MLRASSAERGDVMERQKKAAHHWAALIGWLDSGKLYIRSALLSEVVSANVQAMVQQTCLMNPEHRVQLSHA